MVTRRRLLIVIALLVVIDIATALLYVASHLNADGKYVGAFSDADSVALQADTLPSAVASVKFDPIRDEVVYYVSASSLPSGTGGDNHFTCVKQVKLKMPHSVNGSTAIDDLKNAILTKAFGSGHGDETSSVNAFVDAPEFNMGGNSDYRISPNPVTTQRFFGREHRVKVFPYLSSERLLEYEIYAFVYDGHLRTERVGFVLYDCLRRRVLRPSDVLSIADAEGVAALLKAVNRRIDFIARRDKQRLRHATSLNAEVAVERGGIKLVFPAGVIADAESGVASVYLPYDSCRALLTAEFRQMLVADGNYRRYKVIKF